MISKSQISNTINKGIYVLHFVWTVHKCNNTPEKRNEIYILRMIAFIKNNKVEHNTWVLIRQRVLEVNNFKRKLSQPLRD